MGTQPVRGGGAASQLCHEQGTPCEARCADATELKGERRISGALPAARHGLCQAAVLGIPVAGKAATFLHRPSLCKGAPKPWVCLAREV